MTSENDTSQLRQRDFLRFLFDGGQSTVHPLDAAAADVSQNTDFDAPTSYISNSSLEMTNSNARNPSNPMW